MSDDLSVAFERLRTSTQRLNSVCDTANDVFRDVEQFLEQSQVGIGASVSLGFGADSVGATEPEWEDFLAYRRMASGKFRIVLGRIEIGSGPNDQGYLRAWSECSREDKIDAIAKLPDLLVELAKEVESRTVEAEKALASIGSVVRPPKSKRGS